MRSALVETARQFEIRFYAVLKPITDAESTGNATMQSNSKKVFEIDYSKRCGALEVQVAFKTPSSSSDSRLVNHILFSKIFHGCWPVLKEVQALFEYLLDHHRFNRVDDDEPTSGINMLKLRKRKDTSKTKKKVVPATKSLTATTTSKSSSNDNIQSLDAEFDFRKPRSVVAVVDIASSSVSSTIHESSPSEKDNQLEE